MLTNTIGYMTVQTRHRACEEQICYQSKFNSFASPCLLNPMTDIKLDPNDQVLLDQAVSHIEERVEILREAEPYLIDMSAREATLSS